MKKYISSILIFLLAFALPLSLGGCKEPSSESENSNLKIIATIFPQFDFARQIAGEKAQVQMLITPGTESHSFEPTTSDIMAINDCDIFIYTGGESDSWIDDLLKNTDNKDMTVVSLMECVEHIDDPHHTEHEEEHHHNHSHTDEHVWTSPVNAMKMAEKICSVMCESDPTNADYYRTNLSKYLTELRSLDTEFREVTANAKRNTFVFADRYPLTYFSREYSLGHYAAFSGCSEDTEPSAATVARLIDTVKAESIPVILKIELSSDSIANTISKETGAKVMTFYSCHNISKSDFNSGETYLSLMQKNVETLRTALN